jgi:hypothetical protein
MTTPPVEYGCDWPVDPACFTEEWDALDDTVKARSVDLASATLRRLTGYRVGGCPITVRPCKQGCRDLAYPSYYDMLAYGTGLSFWPHIGADGLWVNSCGCATDCSCSVLCEIELPPPVGPVIQVRLDGGIMVDTQYRVDGNRLVWIGDQTGCPWPACQDLSQPDTEPDTFSVTYLNAYPVDTIGAYAAGVLAMEFAKACTGKKCRLPANVTAVTRQGVSFEIAAGSFPGGMTGIREVDTFIGLWNPRGIQPPQVWSPDMRVPRVVPTG